MARLGHLVEKAVRIEDRRRHERLGFAAGVAEHDALVAGAFVLAALFVDIHATRNVDRLFV